MASYFYTTITVARKHKVELHIHNQPPLLRNDTQFRKQRKQQAKSPSKNLKSHLTTRNAKKLPLPHHAIMPAEQ